MTYLFIYAHKIDKTKLSLATAQDSANQKHVAMQFFQASYNKEALYDPFCYTPTYLFNCVKGRFLEM